MDKSEENKKLAELININKDAAEFYSQAQEKVESNTYKTTFKNLEIIHEDVAKSIETTVRSRGMDKDFDGTIKGSVDQFFGKLATAISNDVDEALIKHLEEAEDRCLHTVQDIMNKDGISPETKTALSSEMKTLRKTHDYMKELKEYVKDAA